MGKQCIFDQSCGNPRAFVGTIGVGCLVHTRSRGKPSKGGSSLWGHLILIMPVSGLHIGLDDITESFFFL